MHKPATLSDDAPGSQLGIVITIYAYYLCWPLLPVPFSESIFYLELGKFAHSTFRGGHIHSFSLSQYIPPVLLVSQSAFPHLCA